MNTLTLEDFYDDIYLWVTGQKYSGTCYYENVGLCSNFAVWVDFMVQKYDLYDVVAKDTLKDSFYQSLVLECGDLLAFNANLEEYRYESDKYTNKKRLQWIKDHSRIALSENEGEQNDSI